MPTLMRILEPTEIMEQWWRQSLVPVETMLDVRLALRRK
jgi:hypothetical protein